MLLGCLEIPQGVTGHDAGRQLLEKLYREYTGEDMPAISTQKRGKPYFPDSPVCFSVSHTKHWVFCALDDAPIGIDAEELDRKVSPKLAEKILSPFEYAQYTVAEDKNRALLTFWVLKEARAKLSGQGLRGYPDNTRFSLGDPRVTAQNGCLLAVIKEEDHAV